MAQPADPQSAPVTASDDPASADLRWMQQALLMARRAAAIGEVPVGAVVVKDGECIARAHNRRLLDADPSAHAELVAMRRAARLLGDFRLEGCTVYVTLEPCPMCAGAMVLARITRCVFGCRDPKGGFLGSLADLSGFSGLNHSFEVLEGVAGEECSEELRRFFRELRRARSR